jgi:hypothetical protein
VVAPVITSFTGWRVTRIAPSNILRRKELNLYYWNQSPVSCL